MAVIAFEINGAWVELDTSTEISGEIYGGLRRQGLVSGNFLWTVSANGMVENVYAAAGQTVSAGDTLLTLRAQKIFASQDGTVARVLAAEGDKADGTVLEIAPTSRFDVYCTVSGAYASAEMELIHPGETLYLRCSADGTRRAIGVVTNPDGGEYRVETLGGELYVGEVVKLYRDADFSANQCVGVGTVVASAVEEYSAAGTIVRLCVSEDETVERGQLFCEISVSEAADIAAPVSGIIAEIAAASGDEVSAEQAAEIQRGNRVQVVFAANPEEEITMGTVAEILLIEESGT